MRSEQFAHANVAFEAGLFFGRERFVDELVAKVRQRTPTNTATVVGRSGSGKSSIVYAGLFPALRRPSHPRRRNNVRI